MQSSDALPLLTNTLDAPMPHTWTTTSGDAQGDEFVITLGTGETPEGDRKVPRLLKFLLLAMIFLIFTTAFGVGVYAFILSIMALVNNFNLGIDVIFDWIYVALIIGNGTVVAMFSTTYKNKPFNKRTVLYWTAGCFGCTVLLTIGLLIRIYPVEKAWRKDSTPGVMLPDGLIMLASIIVSLLTTLVVGLLTRYNSFHKTTSPYGC